MGGGKQNFNLKQKQTKYKVEIQAISWTIYNQLSHKMLSSRQHNLRQLETGYP